MYPELLHIGKITIYTYAFLIVLGTYIASVYTKWRAKKELGIDNLSNTFFYLIFIAGFIGGKLFFYLERPSYFFANPRLILVNFFGGFVFYGSLITIIPVTLWYLKRHKIKILPMLDILAFTTLIVHSIGRLGCFFGGCCYGKATHSFIGIAFPKTNGVRVHPTQLYEITVLLIIICVLLYIKQRQQFKGQLFFLYLIFYAITRNFLELLRGDKRGYIIEKYLSHSQLIGIILLFTTLFIYQKIKKQQISIKI